MCAASEPFPECRYENSVTLRGSILLMSRRKAPGRSGMATDSSVSEESARSETNRSESKFMLAPEQMATYVWSRVPLSSAHFFNPAMPSAPAGSRMERVSIKQSLIAEQISSVDTVTISSTSSLQMRNVSEPTFRTAAPSANRPTWSNSCSRPLRSEAVIPAASAASTPMTSTPGRTRFTYAAMPANMPPPPQHTKMAWSGLPVICFRISMPMVPWPAMTSGSSNGWMRVRPSTFTSL
mmetsp:Transcript_27378/g.88426  ORF Transcript_27378/g.88426 Transcript_27378/m.88426 type:complete len:238 (-) Transcript_27378:661-1374(-)